MEALSEASFLRFEGEATAEGDMPAIHGASLRFAKASEEDRVGG